MSDSVRPHRWQPTRLPHSWDSPGKNTGVGCHFLLQCRKVKSESKVVQSCQTLSNPVDCSLPGSTVHGIFQARVLEWGAIAFSISYARYLLFLSFIVPILAWNISLISLFSWKRSLVFPILFFSSISLHWSLRKAFFISPCYSLELCIQMGISFLFSFPFTSHLFTVICKASSGNYFVFLPFFFLGMVLAITSCAMLWTSIHGIFQARVLEWGAIAFSKER